jgi:hypothetical protein
VPKQESQSIDSERPKYLRWKCIDNFTKMDKSKMFYKGNYTPTQSMIDTLTPIFEEIKQKYTKEINAWLNKDKKSLKIAGGSYTFFFVLPEIFKFASDEYPLMPIELVMENIRTAKELADNDADLILGGYYSDSNGNFHVEDYPFSNIQTTHYIMRKRFDDRICLGVSKNALFEFEDVNAVLNYHDILFSRLDEAGEKKYLYAPTPKNREEEDPRVVVDSYFMSYLMMQQNVGIADVLSSMNKSDTDNLLVVDNSILSIARRMVFYKKKAKHLNHFGKRIFKILNRGSK